MRTYWIVALSLVYGLIAQTTTLIDPTTDGGFEGSHGWTLVNSPTYPNRWCVGSAAPALTGQVILPLLSATPRTLQPVQLLGPTGGAYLTCHAYKQITRASRPAVPDYLAQSQAKTAEGNKDCVSYLIVPATMSLPQPDVPLDKCQYRLFASSTISENRRFQERRLHRVNDVNFIAVSHVTCADARASSIAS
jgi:hypothetical protein